MKPLKGNEVDHSHENAIKIAFLLSFNLSGYKTNSEIEFRESEQSYTKWADLVVPDQKIHIEFKNIQMNNILFSNGRTYNSKKSDWDLGVKYAKEIDEMSQAEILKLKLKYPIENQKSENLLGKDLCTVGDVFENLKSQTMQNQKWIGNKLGKTIHSFYVLRIGLYSLIHGKIE